MSPLDSLVALVPDTWDTSFLVVHDLLLWPVAPQFWQWWLLLLVDVPAFPLPPNPLVSPQQDHVLPH